MKRDTSYVIKRAEHFKSILTAEGFLVGCLLYTSFQGSEFFNDFPGVCGYADVRKIGYGGNGICRVDKCPAGAFLSVKDCFHFFSLSFNNRDLIWLVMCFGMVSSISMSLLYMRTPW